MSQPEPVFHVLQLDGAGEPLKASRCAASGSPIAKPCWRV
jgi:hypothetical protein